MSPPHFSPGLLKTWNVYSKHDEKPTISQWPKGPMWSAAYLSLPMSYLSPPPNSAPVTLAAFLLNTPKYPHLREFAPAVFLCLEYSSQYLQILPGLSARVTSTEWTF